MEIQKFKELSNRIYRDIQEFNENDVECLQKILVSNTISYDPTDVVKRISNIQVIKSMLKYNSLLLIKHLSENKITLPDSLLDCVISVLISDTGRTAGNNTIGYMSGSTEDTRSIDTNPVVNLEKERIDRKITLCAIDIIYITKYHNEKLVTYVTAKTIPDDISVNLAPLIQGDYKSFELIVINKCMPGPVLYNLVTSYKTRLCTLAKETILEKLEDSLEKMKDDPSHIYRIFYLLNTKDNPELLKKSKENSSVDYLKFVCSLVHSAETAAVAYSKLRTRIEEIDLLASQIMKNTANTSLLSSKEVDRKYTNRQKSIILQNVEKSNFEYLFSLLQCVNSIAVHKTLPFYRFLGSIQKLLLCPVGRKIKGIIYEILCVYLKEKDTPIENVISCREELESELECGDYYLLSRVLKFISMYHSYRSRNGYFIDDISRTKDSGVKMNFQAIVGYSTEEIENSDFSDVKKENISDIENYCYRTALRSEDPVSVVRCLESDVSYSIIENNTKHLRNTMLKSVEVVEEVINFQISRKKILDDTSLVSIICCTPSSKFFEYVGLFGSFTQYLNSDVLERIEEDCENGILWLERTYNRDVGLFIIRYIERFNRLIRKYKYLQKIITPLYEKLLDEHIETIKIQVVDSQDKKAVQEERRSMFILYSDESLVSDEFFRIQSKQLLYEKFYKDRIDKALMLTHPYSHRGYAYYIKAKLVCGIDVKSDLQYLCQNNVETGDLMGYVKIATDSYLRLSKMENESSSLSKNIICNFGIKDSNYFCSNFSDASDVEKFVLFFSIDNVNRDIENIIKEETLRAVNMASVYLDMCVMLLFRCRDIDTILKILEKTYSDKELLFKLNLYNISNGGSYCSKTLINEVSVELRQKALFLIYYTKVWDKEYVISMLERMREEETAEIEDLFRDLPYY